MCYGNLDPGYAIRETEARLGNVYLQGNKGISLQGIADPAPASGPAFGPVSWLRAALARLNRKDKAHV
ncbi:MAG: hypothetical protein IOC80_13710 [Rhodobacter sp.]|nr:hypothetical protein [Rhodobacter sp.]MCA3520063.1 hypothetical protein [Rhodobacter sp.]MCA3522978.1 hypothetical protein [Rhodobacter sp.]MCA3525161.1 hypothetical protein [Rhodobacter sp.]MCA3528454.1 hypothetical protein [Rhodobacter sp.]